MTTITTTCTGCGRQLAVPARYQGRELKCPHCGHSFRVDPQAPHTAEPARASAPAHVPAPPPTAAPPAAAASHAPQDNAGPFGDLFTASADASATPPTKTEAAPVETGPVYWRLRRLDVLSTGVVSGVIYAALGLLVGIAVAVASVFLPGPAIPFVRGKVIGGLAVVVLPLLYGTIGFVAGALLALLYNVTARLVGGVKVLLE